MPSPDFQIVCYVYRGDVIQAVLERAGRLAIPAWLPRWGPRLKRRRRFGYLPGFCQRFQNGVALRPPSAADALGTPVLATALQKFAPHGSVSSRKADVNRSLLAV